MSTKKQIDKTKDKKKESKTPAKSEPARKIEPARKQPAGKKKLVVSYKNLPPDVLELLKEKYPRGYADVLIKVDKGNGQFFYGVTLDTEEVDYLVKVDVKIDSEPDEIERAFFGSGDHADHQDDDEFPDDEGTFEQTEDDE